MVGRKGLGQEVADPSQRFGSNLVPHRKFFILRTQPHLSKLVSGRSGEIDGQRLILSAMDYEDVLARPIERPVDRFGGGEIAAHGNYSAKGFSRRQAEVERHRGALRKAH